MSALRDGGIHMTDSGVVYAPTASSGGGTNVYAIIIEPHRVSFWRRLWFLVSCIPRYLITGSVEVP